MPDNIFEMIFQTLYRYRVECGPNKSSYQYVPKAYNISVFDVPYIVPDQIYKPKICITIDFTSTYAIDGERIVSNATLQNAYKTLLDFYYYYFEYEMSYNRVGNKNSTGSAGITDKSVNEFINYMLNFFLTNITVQRSVNSVGTASFTLKDNWNVKNTEKIRLFFNKAVPILNQLFVPMLPIMFWGSGRIYKDWVFPLFDGYITSVSDSNSEGFISITGNCRDALEIARFSHEMVNPAIIQIGEKKGKTQEDINMFEKPFFNVDHFKLIQSMFLGGSLTWAETKIPYKKTGVKQTYRDIIVGHKLAGYQTFDGIGNYGLATDFYDDTTAVYGFPAKICTTPINNAEESRAIKKADFSIATGLKKTKHPPKDENPGDDARLRNIVTWGAQITPYRDFSFAGIEVFQSSFDSRLDIIQNVAKLVYYQLYVDAYGNIQYHPYRLSTKFIKNDLLYYLGEKRIEHENIFPGAQIIGPEETFASNCMYNIEELITHLRLSGTEPTTHIQPELGNIIGSYTATTLESRFGYRRADVSCPLFNNGDLYVKDAEGKLIRFMDLAARELLMFTNSELYSRSDTICFRPELELAMPLCIIPEREIFYIQSITHTVDIGGSARTEINSNFGRSYLSQAPDMQSIILDADQYFRGTKSPPDFSSDVRTYPSTFVDKIQNVYEKKEKELIDYIDAAAKISVL